MCSSDLGQMRLLEESTVTKSGDHTSTTTTTTTNTSNKSTEEEEVYYHNLFPLRQLFIPAVEYPLWDENWDERQVLHPPLTTTSSSNVNQDEYDQYKKHVRQLRKNGVTRHIIFIRHGQYDETHKVCYVHIMFSFTLLTVSFCFHRSDLNLV